MGVTILNKGSPKNNRLALILHLQDNKINWKCEVTNYHRDGEKLISTLAPLTYAIESILSSFEKASLPRENCLPLLLVEL